MQIPYVLLLYLHQELKPLRDLVHRTSVQTQMVPMNSKVAKKSLCLGGSWLLSLTRRLLKSQARTSPAALYSKYSESLPKPEAPSHLLYNKCPLVSALLAVREPPSPPPRRWGGGHASLIAAHLPAGSKHSPRGWCTCPFLWVWGEPSLSDMWGWSVLSPWPWRVGVSRSAVQTGSLTEPSPSRITSEHGQKDVSTSLLWEATRTGKVVA